MVGTNKSLGQHWLKNREILEQIADLAGEGGLCLEIGPGLGTLTSSLLRRFSKVMAVEYDARLAENLPKSFPGKNLEVLNEDILKFDFSQISGDYVVAGNIPYYITSPIIEKLLTVSNRPKRIVLLIQKEVAERILSPKESILSLMVKNRAKVFAGPEVSREEFTPPPKVDSKVIVLEPLKNQIVSDEVFKLIRLGFVSPRKKLVANLAGILSRDELKKGFLDLGISLDARPADLELEDWKKLYEILYK
ncbi:ribosomal RNA small subunit methyltransferase A [Candidatus Saccharibacteria bacterium]|nr:ribosomal RNA small subunit methyltransferase A [Candidatus Saccharibacteria bacterium]